MCAGALALALLALVVIPEVETMQTSDAGRLFIARHEGLRLKAYRDAVGVWTVGFGHSSAAGAPRVRPGMVISREEADAILAKDLRKFERAVWEETRGVTLSQHEFDALVSLAFNIGPGNFKKSSVLRYLLSRKKSEAGASFSMWVKAKGRVLAGLVRRRREERRLFLTGNYGLPKPSEHKPSVSGPAA